MGTRPEYRAKPVTGRWLSSGVTSSATAVPVEPEEVRVAMALNGGVSLAVWMGGCAVELDRARRSQTARDEAPRIYDTLCEAFDWRLAIDILTGSSAGGINGGLLGAAMVSGRRLDPNFLRSSWLDLGDLTSLLHGSAEQEPRSLMQGKRFHEGLLGAFDCVLGSGGQEIWREACRPETAERSMVPSLDITMTDTIGVERRFRDAWGGVLRAKEHRPRFRFRRRAHFTAEALADATRTSASFPLAFEPWPVKDAARRLAGLPNPTFGIDGGLLDNAPIRAALELIPTRAAGSSVRRYVCYMNGDPPAPPGEEATRAEPGLRQIGGYVISLPREAPFVNHLYAIQHAVERPRLSGDTQERLLHMDLDELHGVAEALFDTYRRRRAAQSLRSSYPNRDTPVSSTGSSTGPTGACRGYRTRSTGREKTTGNGGFGRLSASFTCCSTSCARRWGKPMTTWSGPTYSRASGASTSRSRILPRREKPSSTRDSANTARRTWNRRSTSSTARSRSPTRGPPPPTRR